MEAVNINLYNILKNDFKLSESKALEFAQAIKDEVQNDMKLENNEYKSILKDDFHKNSFVLAILLRKQRN